MIWLTSSLRNSLNFSARSDIGLFTPGSVPDAIGVPSQVLAPRGVRSPLDLPCVPLSSHFGLVLENHQLGFSLDSRHHTREDLVCMPPLCTHAGHRELRPLPSVLEVHFCGGHVELVVQAVEQTLDQPPLVLEVLAPRKAEFHMQNANYHRAIRPWEARGRRGAESTNHALRVLGWLFAHLERFEEVSDLDIVESFEANPAFEPFSYLAHVLFEPAQ